MTSILSMLSIVAANIRLRELFRRLEWPFPSSVAGMACLFAGELYVGAWTGGGRKSKKQIPDSNACER